VGAELLNSSSHRYVLVLVGCLVAHCFRIGQVVAAWQMVFVSYIVLPGFQDGCKVTAPRTQIQNGGQDV
jgi:hypothetical protein